MINGISVHDWYKACASLSLISTFSVIFSVIMIPKLFERYYIRLICFMCGASFIFCIGDLIGKSHDGSFPCYLQAFIYFHFPLSNILWMVVITYQLYLVVLHEKNIENEYIVHFLCWGFPFVGSILPLSTCAMGTWKDDPYGTCGFKESSPDFTKWEIVWDSYVYISIFIMIFFLVKIYRHTRRLSEINLLNKYVILALGKLKYYPVVGIITYSLQTAIDISILMGEEVNEGMFNFSNCIVLLQGTWCALIFWCQNMDVFIMLWNSISGKNTSEDITAFVEDEDSKTKNSIVEFSSGVSKSSNLDSFTDTLSAAIHDIEKSNREDLEVEEKLKQELSKPKTKSHNHVIVVNPIVLEEGKKSGVIL